MDMGERANTDLFEVSENTIKEINTFISKNPQYGYKCLNEFCEEAVTRFLFQESQ